jgi:hypothetical protein
MALYLNLYHEIQKQKLKRQRDPLKLAVMSLLVVAAGLVAYYFWRTISVKHSQQLAGEVMADLKKYDPLSKDAQTQIDTYQENIKLADAIIHKMENRFYWAPLLGQIITVVPEDVQITGLDGSISSDGLKKVSLTVTGIATGGQPRAVAEELRIALQNKLSTQYTQSSAVFRSLDDGVEPVQYMGKSSPTVLFIIDVTFTSPDIDDAGKNAKPTRHPKT